MILRLFSDFIKEWSPKIAAKLVFRTNMSYTALSMNWASTRQLHARVKDKHCLLTLERECQILSMDKITSRTY